MLPAILYTTLIAPVANFLLGWPKLSITPLGAQPPAHSPPEDWAKFLLHLILLTGSPSTSYEVSVNDLWNTGKITNIGKYTVRAHLEAMTRLAVPLLTKQIRWRTNYYQVARPDRH